MNVLQSFGPEVVQVEMADGRLRLLPVAWLSLSPPKLAQVDGKPVRLALEALQTLADWVAARVAEAARDRRKLDHFDKLQDKVVPDGAPRTGTVGKTASSGHGRSRADNKVERRATAAVVEQAGPSGPGSRGGRRAAQGKRGSR